MISSKSLLQAHLNVIMHQMEKRELVEKFGGEFVADPETFHKGVSRQFAQRIAKRFEGQSTILETCCGAGFATIHLANVANKVIAVDINKVHLEQAKKNVEIANLSSKVEFIWGDILDPDVLEEFENEIDAAFLDPNWTSDGSLEAQHATILSEMQPDGELLFQGIYNLTPNIAFRLPKEFDCKSLNDKPDHGVETFRQGNKTIFYCSYFGDLKDKLS